MMEKGRYLLAKRIREHRAARGWSQAVLAELCGIDRNYIGAIERAKHNVGIDTAQTIAEAFSLSVAELLTEPRLIRRPPKPKRQASA